MILRLALREMWALRSTLSLQLAGLVVAIAALAGGANLAATTGSGTVPGAACADDVRELSGVDERGVAQTNWTPRQAKALIADMDGIIGAEVMPSRASVETASGPRDVPVAFVGKQYFKMVCVPRYDRLGREIEGAFTKGAAIDSPMFHQQFMVDGKYTSADALTRGYLGLQYKTEPQALWVPADVAWARGAGFMDLDVAVVSLYVRPTAHMSEARIREKLEKTLHAQPTLFAGLRTLRLAPALQLDAWTAEKVKSVTTVLGMFAAGLLLLVVVNVVTYQVGRLPVIEEMATTLAALGIPPRAILGYAATEPFVIGAIALLIGMIVGTPLAHYALAAVTNEAASLSIRNSLAATAFASAASFLLAGSVLALRWRALSRRSAPSRGKGAAALLRLLPMMLSLQVAVAGVTLVLAAQAAVGLLKALPPPPNFPLEGLSVVTIRTSLGTPVEENLQSRWAAATRSKARAGYAVALATANAPFLPIRADLGTIGANGRSVKGAYNSVTSDFFEVIGGPRSAAPAFLNAAPGEKAHDGEPVVLSKGFAKALFDGAPPAGSVVLTNRDPNRALTSADASSPVVAMFDDGVVGARGAQARFDVNRLSMQAAVPLAYVPLDSVEGATMLYVFVRHPPNANASQIGDAVMPVVDTIFPGAELESVDSARTLFRNPLSKERAMAIVLSILALASLAVGIFGMTALLAMLLGRLRVELAVRYAVGASRSDVARTLVNQVLPAGVLGFVIALVAGAAGLYFLANSLESSGRAGAWGAVLGMLALVGVFSFVLTRATRRIRATNFMDWLRYE